MLVVNSRRNFVSEWRGTLKHEYGAECTTDLQGDRPQREEGGGRKEERVILALRHKIKVFWSAGRRGELWE